MLADGTRTIDIRGRTIQVHGRRERRERRTQNLLERIAGFDGEGARPEALAEATSLGPRVYPLLAELARDGLVETRWCHDDTLAYRLTAKGRDRLARSNLGPS